MNSPTSGPKIQRAERHGSIDLEYAFRLVVQARDLHLGFLDAGQNIDAALVVGQPRLCRADAPRRPVQKSRAEQLLELHHALADSRTGEARGAARLGVTSECDDLHKCIHGIELVHDAL